MGATASAVGAATAHPSYPLGTRASCRADYHKHVRSHRVHGRLVHYVECIYKAPPERATEPVAPATPTMTPTPTTPPAAPEPTTPPAPEPTTTFVATAVIPNGSPGCQDSCEVELTADTYADDDPQTVIYPNFETPDVTPGTFTWDWTLVGTADAGCDFSSTNGETAAPACFGGIQDLATDGNVASFSVFNYGYPLVLEVTVSFQATPEYGASSGTVTLTLPTSG